MNTASFLRNEAMRVSQLPEKDGIPQAVLLMAEHVYGEHPEWDVSQVYAEVLRAISGTKPYATFWRITRGTYREDAQDSSEIVAQPVEESVPF